MSVLYRDWREEVEAEGSPPGKRSFRIAYTVTEEEWQARIAIELAHDGKDGIPVRLPVRNPFQPAPSALPS